jgi:hypothetical protein
MQFTDYPSYFRIWEWMGECGDTHQKAGEVIFSTPNMHWPGQVARPGDWIARTPHGFVAEPPGYFVAQPQVVNDSTMSGLILTFRGVEGNLCKLTIESVALPHMNRDFFFGADGTFDGTGTFLGEGVADDDD